jgi:hypothetical protein
MNRSLLALAIILSLAALLGAARSTPSPPAERDGHADYVGDEACQSCHAEKVETFHQTAHYLTSRPASGGNILGKFTPGDNILKTANPRLYFQMDERLADGKDKDKDSETKETGFFQTAVEGTPPHTAAHSERFAFVVGSGGKGQTYLFWKGSELFQLPVSYWTVLGWVNSPGYRDGFADFDRPIVPRCLECHATYFKSLPPPPNRYSATGFELGIQCEKCHGPGQKHIEQEKLKSTFPSTAVLNPARFERDRQMDLCAWCHAGAGEPSQPTFSYVPGAPLEKYIDLPQPGPRVPLDVHGNQVAMLKQSLCYLGSTMTCLTCHNVHTAQHDPVEFSQHCLSCHKPDSKTFAKPEHPLSTNCIDCHMPKQETNLIVFDAKGRRSRPQIRNHWIKIYPEFETSVANP